MASFQITAPRSTKSVRHKAFRIIKLETAASTRLSRLISQNKASELLEVDSSFIERIPNLSRDHESSQLSGQLREIRRFIDKRSSSAAADRIKLYHSEIKIMNRVHKQSLARSKKEQKSIENLLQEIQKVKQKQLVEQKNLEIYVHLLSRLEKTRVHLLQDYNAKNQDLKSLHSRLEIASRLKENTRLSLSRTKIGLRQAVRSVSREKALRYKDLGMLHQDLNRLFKAKTRKGELRGSHKDYLEQELIKQICSRSGNLREKLMLARFWFFALESRLKGKMNTWKRLNTAFQIIKNRTGIFQISEVVEKFLTKEKNYDDLMDTIYAKENELEQIKDKIERIQEDVNHLNNFKDSNVKELSLEFIKTNSKFKQSSALLIRLKNIRQKVSTFVDRVALLVDRSLDESSSRPKTTLKDDLIYIKGQVHKALASLPITD